MFLLALTIAVLAIAHALYARRARPNSAWLLDDTPLLMARLVVGGVFVIAACYKVADPVSFAQTIYNFRAVPVYPVQVSILAAVVLPYIELLAGAALIMGVRGRAASLVVGGLLTVFTVAVLAAWMRGIDISCGCMGKHDTSRTDLKKVWANTAQLIPVLSVLVLGPGRLTLERLLQRTEESNDATGQPATATDA